MLIEQFISKQKQQNLLWLAVFSFLLVAFRIVATQRVFYSFLIFNLILAIIPFVISFMLIASPRWHTNKYLLLLGTAAWLLFLPNAPYIVTDILHFKKESAMPEWFDVLMLMSFSCSGLAFGFTSLSTMQQLWEFRFGKKMAVAFIFFGCMVSGLGIYIGRFLRYNSWDILSKPFALISDMPPLLFQPKAIGFTIGYGVFFFLFYRIFKNENQPAS